MSGWQTNPNGSATFHTDNYGSITVSSLGSLVDASKNISSISSKAHGYHEYSVFTAIGPVSHVDVNSVFDSLLSAATPLADDKVFSGKYSNIPVLGTVSHYVDYENLVVANITVGNHLLAPGVVFREVEVVGNLVGIRTTGIGTGFSLYDIVNIFAQLTWELMQQDIRLDYIVPMEDIGAKCFRALTPVTFASGKSTPIQFINIGDSILAFTEGSTSLTPARVTRLFHNITEEWIELNWLDPANGEPRTLTATPGHVMATPEGGWKQLIEMVVPPSDRDADISPSMKERDDAPPTRGEEFGTPIGSVRLVTAQGDIVVARAHHLKYSAATAHLFEEAEMLVTRPPPTGSGEGVRR